MFVVKRLNNMSKIRKRGIDMTREEKEDRKLELLDNMLFGEKNDSKRRGNKGRASITI
jgi:hypothetical protein